MAAWRRIASVAMSFEMQDDIATLELRLRSCVNIQIDADPLGGALVDRQSVREAEPLLDQAIGILFVVEKTHDQLPKPGSYDCEKKMQRSDTKLPTKQWNPKSKKQVSPREAIEARFNLTGRLVLHHDALRAYAA